MVVQRVVGVVRTSALLAATMQALVVLAPHAPPAAAEPGGQLQQKARAADAVVHRGLRTSYAGRVADENSPRACVNAVTRGADACEIDVRITRDGVPVLMHDPTTSRTTRGRGCDLTVARHTYARLVKCRLNHGDRLPRLTDAAAAMRPYAGTKGLVVELKGRAFSRAELVRVNRNLQRYGFVGHRGNLVYESFSRSNVVRVKQLNPRTPALLISTGRPVAAAVDRDGIDGLILPYRSLVRALAADPGYVRDFRGRGLQLMPWSVNGTGAMRHVVAAGATGFMTDDARTLRAALALRTG